MRTILIVDDHADFRASARVLLESEGFDVVGEAATGSEGVERARALRPEIVLLDVHLPDLHGFEVAERLAALPDAPAVVLTSSRSDYSTAVSSTRARGFVPKDELSGAAIEHVLADTSP